MFVNCSLCSSIAVCVRQLQFVFVNCSLCSSIAVCVRQLQFVFVNCSWCSKRHTCFRDTFAFADIRPEVATNANRLLCRNRDFFWGRCPCVNRLGSKPGENWHRVRDLGHVCCNVVCAFCIFWSIVPWIVLRKKGGHKASSYRQIEQYPDPTRRSYCSGRIRPPAYSRKDQLSI